MAYKAFVSSTYEDLKAHREHVISELRQAGIHVDPMEDWTSTSDEPSVFSRDRLDGCEFCVLLVAFRRGFVAPGDQRSITQLEYDEAKRRGIDILPFMLRNDALWRRQYDELESDPEMQPWRQGLMNDHGVSFFDHTPASVEVAPAVTRWVAEKQRNKNQPQPAAVALSGAEKKQISPTKPIWKQAVFAGPVAAATLLLIGILVFKFARPPDITPPRKATIADISAGGANAEPGEGFTVFYTGASDDTSLQEVRLWTRFESDDWEISSDARTGKDGQFLIKGLQRSGRYYFDVVSTDAAGNRSHDPRGTQGQRDISFIQPNDTLAAVAERRDKNTFTEELKELASRRPAILLSRDGVVGDVPEYWSRSIERFSNQINRASASTGRIELRNHRSPWVGTGFVVSDSVIVSAAFVAKEIFEKGPADTWEFKTGINGKRVRAAINFALSLIHI